MERGGAKLVAVTCRGEARALTDTTETARVDFCGRGGLVRGTVATLFVESVVVFMLLRWSFYVTPRSARRPIKHGGVINIPM